MCHGFINFNPKHSSRPQFELAVHTWLLYGYCDRPFLGKHMDFNAFIQPKFRILN